jgi:uncharacterized protein (TIGR02246 family)
MLCGMVVPVLLLVLGVTQIDRTGPPTPATFTTLETAWNEAHVRGDAATLDQLFADDLVVAVPGMRTMSKADSLAVMASGRMKFDRYVSSDTAIRIYDGAAIVTGRIQRTRTVGGRESKDDWLFTKVYVRRAGRWRVVSFHASNAPP